MADNTPPLSAHAEPELCHDGKPHRWREFINGNKYPIGTDPKLIEYDWLCDKCLKDRPAISPPEAANGE